MLWGAWTSGVEAGLHVLASAVTQVFDGMHPQFVLVIAAQMAAYAFAAYAPLVPAALGGLVVLVGLLTVVWSLAPSFNDVAWMTAIVVGPWLAGRVVADQRKQQGELRTAAARLERERETSARLAVAEERTRMARDLHQAIAQSVEIIIRQAVAAEAALSESSPQAREALRVVQGTGRDEIAEMRRMLRILRTDDRSGPPPEAPQSPPSPRRVDGWIRRSPRLDLVLALVCLASVEVWVIVRSDFGTSERLISALLAVPATLPLVWRRRMPLAVMLTTSAAVGVQQTLMDFTELTPVVLLIAPLVALYTLAAETSAKRALSGTAPSLLIAAVATAITEGSAWKFIDGMVLYGVYAVGPFICGRAMRLHRRQPSSCAS